MVKSAMGFFAIYWPALIAGLTANAATVIVIYLAWSYYRGHQVSRAALNTGAGIVGVIGLAIRAYFIVMAAFVSLMFAKWLLIG